MHLSTAMNVQNRGAFHIENTAFKAGNSESDRQSGGEAYMMFNDQLNFQQLPVQPEYVQPELNPAMKVLNHLLNMDTRFYIAVIVTAVFSSFFQAMVASTLLTVVVSAVFFVVWYIMSFFDFKKIHDVLVYGAPKEQIQSYPYAY